MRATKENAQAALLCLHRLNHLLPSEDYDRLYWFIRSATKRLPTRAAVERDLERKAAKRSRSARNRRNVALQKRTVLA